MSPVATAYVILILHAPAVFLGSLAMYFVHKKKERLWDIFKTVLWISLLTLVLMLALVGWVVSDDMLNSITGIALYAAAALLYLLCLGVGCLGEYLLVTKFYRDGDREKAHDGEQA